MAHKGYTEEQTKARRKAVEEYQKTIDRVNCRLPKGTKERIQKLGATSINNYILLAVMEKLEHDENLVK